MLLLAEACLCFVFPRIDNGKCPGPPKKLSCSATECWRSFEIFSNLCVFQSLQTCKTSTKKLKSWEKLTTCAIKEKRENVLLNWSLYLFVRKHSDCWIAGKFIRGNISLDVRIFHYTSWLGWFANWLVLLTIEREGLSPRMDLFLTSHPASFFPAGWPSRILTPPPQGFWRLKPAKAGRLRLKPPQVAGNRSFQGFRPILGRKTLLEWPAQAGTSSQKKFCLFLESRIGF